MRPDWTMSQKDWETIMCGWCRKISLLSGHVTRSQATCDTCLKVSSTGMTKSSLVSGLKSQWSWTKFVSIITFLLSSSLVSFVTHFRMIDLTEKYNQNKKYQLFKFMAEWSIAPSICKALIVQNIVLETHLIVSKDSWRSSPGIQSETVLKVSRVAGRLSVSLLSLIHIWRCRRYAVCRSRWSPYH